MANKIIEFRSSHGRRAYRAHPEVPPGTTCYAVQDEATKLHFVWSYVHRDQAVYIASKVEPGDQTDRAFNWRRNIQDTVPSSREPVKA